MTIDTSSDRSIVGHQTGGLAHTIRHKLGGTIAVMLTRQDAIAAFCTECMGWGESHPKDCDATLCPLWMYRGKYNLSLMRKTHSGGRAALDSSGVQHGDIQPGDAPMEVA